MGFPDEVMQFIQIGHGPHPDKYICRDLDNRIWVLNNLEFLTTMCKPHKETAEFRSIDPNSFPATSTVHYFLGGIRDSSVPERLYRPSSNF